MDFLEPGTLLISEPFLDDDNFFRKVVVVIEDNANGSLGVTINDNSSMFINAKNELSDEEINVKLLWGGPVDRQGSINFIHCCRGIDKSIHLGNSLYWGGDVEQLILRHSVGEINESNIWGFSGYCGWGPGQLKEEIASKTWIIGKFDPNYLSMKSSEIWKQSLIDLGGKTAWLAKAPLSVDLN